MFFYVQFHFFVVQFVQFWLPFTYVPATANLYIERLAFRNEFRKERVCVSRTAARIPQRPAVLEILATDVAVMPLWLCPATGHFVLRVLLVQRIYRALVQERLKVCDPVPNASSYANVLRWLSLIPPILKRLHAESEHRCGHFLIHGLHTFCFFHGRLLVSFFAPARKRRKIWLEFVKMREKLKRESCFFLSEAKILYISSRFNWICFLKFFWSATSIRGRRHAFQMLRYERQCCTAHASMRSDCHKERRTDFWLFVSCVSPPIQPLCQQH